MFEIYIYIYIYISLVILHLVCAIEITVYSTLTFFSVDAGSYLKIHFHRVVLCWIYSKIVCNSDMLYRLLITASLYCAQ